MATPAQEFAALRKLTPEEAAGHLARRGQLTKTWSWQDLWQDEHAQQFTVSRLTRLDLLEDIRNQITRSVGGDLSRRDFMRDSEKLLAGAGWWGEKTVRDEATGEDVTTKFDPARLKLIYDTNTRMAYSAGLWERMERNKKTHPYVRYITQGDERVRVAHQAWANVTLPIDDPFWQTHYPPNGWRCRCRAVAVSRRDYDAGVTPTGAPMVKTAPAIETREWVNKRTGEVSRVPVGIDPGFGYNVGAASMRAASLQRVAAEKLEGAPANLARPALTGLMDGPAFAQWLKKPSGAWPLAVLPAADALLIGAQQRVALLSEASAMKQLREHAELRPDEYAQAQRVVDSPSVRVQDSPNSLIYVLSEDGDDSGGYVVVVKATRTGEGLFVTSFRRLSREDARRDAEVARLLAKGAKK